MWRVRSGANVRVKAGTLVVFCALAGVLTSTLTTTPALAVEEYVSGGSFGGEGAGDGQFKEPVGVAVNDSTEPLVEPAAGDVYVVDRGNGRVERFSSAGVYISQFNGAETPAKGFSEPGGIAVDASGSALDPSAGDVYVEDVGHKVIDKFSSTGVYISQLTETTGGSTFGRLSGVAVDRFGSLWVYEESGNVDEFSDTGSFVKTFNTELGVTPGLAVDASENLYVISGGESAVKLGRFGEHVELSFGVSALAVNPSTDNLLLDQGNSIALYGSELSASSTPIQTFPDEGLLAESHGLAVSVTGAAYATERGANDVEIFNYVALPQPRVIKGSASPLTATSEVLHGTVNPQGEPITECHFEYGAEASVYPQTAPCAQSPSEIGNGGEQVVVSATVPGLQLNAVYHYRLSVANANGTKSTGDQIFTTASPPTVAGESVTNAASTSATFAARVTPGGADTTYRFEYGTTVAYGATAPVPDGDAGSGFTSAPAGAHVQDLLPSTSYHYRVTATNALGTAAGPDQTFRTQAQGGASTLPDGRQWELISPPNKHGAQVFSLQTAGNTPVSAAKTGDAIAYPASAPFAGESSPGNLQTSEALSRRDEGNWSTQDISTPNDEAVARSSLAEYPLFSPDLSRALVTPLGRTNLSPEATERTIYVRDNATSSFTPLVTSSNVAPGVHFGGNGEANPLEGLHLIAATPDLSHVVILSQTVLTTEGGSEGAPNFYEWAAGTLRLINGATYIGSPGGTNTRHAISDDGSRIVWGDSGGNLHVQDTTTGESVMVNVAQNVPEPPPNQAKFQVASSDGSKVFFTDEAQLTTTPGGGLYVYEVTSKPGETPAGRLTLLTVTVNSGEAAGVSGVVLGAAEDGSRLYVVAGGILTEHENGEHEKAELGANNLYALHSEVHTGVTQWAPSFIAGLSSEDQPSWNPTPPNFDRLSSRVSPNGRYLTFMSERSLTGYDNRDANSGVSDEEVFLYDANTDRLVCGSCDPSGARPEGRQDAALTDPDPPGTWQNRWVAASVPGWNTESDTGFALLLNQPRYLIDGGRLFFNSSSALVPADVNGTWDVYQYEPAGVGSCTSTSQATSEVFDSEADGCIALISNGVGSVESLFADASASGEDVFFTTDDRLVSGDFDSVRDMYDAHVCSSRAPCPPASLVSSPACSTGDSCKPAPSPQPAVFGAPPSATFSGAGNVVSQPPSKPAVKSLTRAQRLAKALRACKRTSKRQRHTCERRARAAYGAKAKARKATNDRRGKR
jgi:hypothetical protein